MTLFRFSEDAPPTLRTPILIAALDGWIDAAGAATAAAEHIAQDAPIIARFDPDALIDYRSRRPTLDIVDGDPKTIAWPDIWVRSVPTDRLDLLVLSGPEPDYRWREFAAAIREMALRLGVIRFVVLGSLGMAVPHTRPTTIIAAGSQPELLADDDRPEGFLRVPSACVSAVELTMRDAGIPTVGFYARAPHYVAATFWPAALALVERLGRHLDVSFPAGPLVELAQQERTQLDRIMTERPEIKEYVEKLEELTPPAFEVPTGDQIAAEIERYLRDPGRGQL